MLTIGFDGDIIYKSRDKTIVVDRISPMILMDKMERAGYSHKFALLSVTHKINMTSKSGAIKLGRELGLLQ